ncbi:MAG: hypothetical protein WCK84_10300 [Bacteroidota bacterium]
MKKQVKVIISIVVAIAILIVGISLFYPTVFSGLTSGTFGKADKYHKTQMSAKDILLRSELVGDTVKLQQMIQGLIYFTIFTQDLSNKIDSGLITFKSKGMGATSAEAAKIKVFQDYSDFIKNNNKTLSTTIRMLTCFYMKDTTDLSQDVEKNMRDFGNYVANLNQKDSILNQALVSMDNFLLTNKTMKAKTKEIASLKSIRDQLLIKGIQLSGMLQNAPLCSQLLVLAISSQAGYDAVLQGSQGAVGAQQQVQAVHSAQTLQRVVSSKELEMVKLESSQQIGNILQSQISAQQAVGKSGNLGVGLTNEAVAAVLYNGATLQFTNCATSQLSKVLSSQELSAVLQGSSTIGSMQAVAVYSTQTLNLVLSNISLQNSLQSIGLQSSMSALQLSHVEELMSQELQSQFIGVSVIAAVTQIGSQGLGMSSDR